ncbi:MAG: LysM peptidoglycan-binding domain-containing protein [Gammaproteobacteria bacterium]|nr:LysM peptidoglycan-binding domain-containing protein [Gammaproteobacteria bacterium]MBU1722997.1 LysM peptidoglycan-binding domain-containing protein [Gammaproteobacteria bacterium]MBU2003798.1 LysM peptidoglycan-binding domain-containing protein [Gammaproteobacteria bacterium]
MEKAQIINLDVEGKNLEVLFNPTEYSLEIGNSYQETALPGLQSPVLQFINGNIRTLTMELLLDAWSNVNKTNADLLAEIDTLRSMMAIDAKLHAPPRVMFKWGELEFTSIIANLSQRFTMFNTNGKPVRATLNVTFKEYLPISKQMELLRLQSVDKTKRRILTADDSIWSIAAREYGHPREWRRIARHNRIEDPLSLIPGDALVLPPVENPS